MKRKLKQSEEHVKQRRKCKLTICISTAHSHSKAHGRSEESKENEVQRMSLLIHIKWPQHCKDLGFCKWNSINIISWRNQLKDGPWMRTIIFPLHSTIIFREKLSADPDTNRLQKTPNWIRVNIAFEHQFLARLGLLVFLPKEDGTRFWPHNNSFSKT